MSTYHDAIKNFQKNVSELGDGRKTFVKYKKGRWFAGADETEVPIGTKFVADFLRAERGHVRFHDRKVVERQMVAMGSPGKPLSREELGHTDAAQWELGRDNKPSDPWKKVFEIPAREIDRENREVVISGSSVGFARAWDALFDKVCKQLAANPGKHPVLELSTGTFKSKNFGTVDCPAFNLVDWVSPDVEVVEDDNFAEDLDNDIPF